MNSTAFLVPGLLGALILVGVIMRATIPLLRRLLVPSCMIGGIVGFVLMNTVEMPFSSEVFTDITYHLFNLSLISITLMSVRKKEKTEKHGSLMLWGGLWMALVFSMLITAQGVIGGGTGTLLSKIGFDGFLPEYGALATHGFAQGPGQGLAIGKSWEGFGVADASQIGLFYAAMGYITAIVVGIPMANYLIKKNKTVVVKGKHDAQLMMGLLGPSSNTYIGKKTSHHTNLDTITLHVSIMLSTYLLTYGTIRFIINIFSLSAQIENMLMSMMFVWGIIIASLVKWVIRVIKFDHLVDRNLQGSITGFVMDFLVVSAMMSISLSIILKYIAPLLIVSFVITLSTALLCYLFSKRTGEYWAERTMTLFGIATGTAATGILMLRLVDPNFETPVAEELIWWNIFNNVTGFIILLAPTMPLLGINSWLLILFVYTLATGTLAVFANKRRFKIMNSDDN